MPDHYGPPDPPDAEFTARDGEARSVSARTDAFTQDELFPVGLVDGDEVTLRNLVRGGLPVKAVVSIAAVEVPSDGLFDPERLSLFLLTARPGRVTVTPEFDGDQSAEHSTVTEWKSSQRLRPVFVERIHDDADTIVTLMAALLTRDPKRAAAAADTISALVAETLSQA